MASSLAWGSLAQKEVASVVLIGKEDEERGGQAGLCQQQCRLFSTTPELEKNDRNSNVSTMIDGPMSYSPATRL
ncbi:hypothetical protein E2562_007812 [Oryza meyeriana var. granulata]|uniref:Uncharacterized protein n=1 Tax=Oryza meyeriana var. granulata TaxID=110450 RepID=A0A6G1F5A9_9ORYZ|nr:hypothetical protein E2562_007812 [Oryza meyeriana var. granulata]